MNRWILTTCILTTCISTTYNPYSVLRTLRKLVVFIATRRMQSLEGNRITLHPSDFPKYAQISARGFLYDHDRSNCNVLTAPVIVVGIWYIVNSVLLGTYSESLAANFSSVESNGFVLNNAGVLCSCLNFRPKLERFDTLTLKFWSCTGNMVMKARLKSRSSSFKTSFKSVYSSSIIFPIVLRLNSSKTECGSAIGYGFPFAMGIKFDGFLRDVECHI